MKSIQRLTFGACTAIGGLALAAVAGAEGFTPVASVLEASGPLTISGGPIKATCTTTLFGNIDVDGSVAFEGDLTTFRGKSGACGLLHGAGNWVAVATSATRAEIRNIRVNGALGIHCKGTLRGTLVDGIIKVNGELTSSIGTKCAVSGTLTTTPTAAISWP